jgi:hypothetical protein
MASECDRSTDTRRPAGLQPRKRCAVDSGDPPAKIRKAEECVLSDIEEEEEEVYIWDCVGGCGTKTNGSQYCRKTFCPHELLDDELTDEGIESDVER